MKAIILLLCLSVFYLCEGSDSDRVRFQDSIAITLHAGKKTTGRGLDPIPQIECVGWCPISEPRTASCVSRGFDGNNIQWECKADLEDGFEFENVDVLCEGYAYNNDPYILQESCRLKYTLRASSKTKKTPYTYEDTGTREKTSRIKDFIRALNKTFMSPAMNYTRTDRSSSNNDNPDDNTSEPRMGWNIFGLGSSDGGCPGCTNCINCPESSGCTSCRNCRNCTGCTACIDCVNCSGSTACTNCTNCTGCTACHNCNNCHGMTGTTGRDCSK